VQRNSAPLLKRSRIAIPGSGKSVGIKRLSVGPPRGFEPRTYALRAVRGPPKATLLLLHTRAYPGMLGHTCPMFRGITGELRDPR
jgi:hypothetical protein